MQFLFSLLCLPSKKWANSRQAVLWSQQPCILFATFPCQIGCQMLSLGRLISMAYFRLSIQNYTHIAFALELPRVPCMKRQNSGFCLFILFCWLVIMAYIFILTQAIFLWITNTYSLRVFKDILVLIYVMIVFLKTFLVCLFIFLNSFIYYICWR